MLRRARRLCAAAGGALAEEDKEKERLNLCVASSRDRPEQQGATRLMEQELCVKRAGEERNLRNEAAVTGGRCQALGKREQRGEGGVHAPGRSRGGGHACGADSREVFSSVLRDSRDEGGDGRGGCHDLGAGGHADVGAQPPLSHTHTSPSLTHTSFSPHRRSHPAPPSHLPQTRPAPPPERGDRPPQVGGGAAAVPVGNCSLSQLLVWRPPWCDAAQRPLFYAANGNGACHAALYYCILLLIC